MDLWAFAVLGGWGVGAVVRWGVGVVGFDGWQIACVGVWVWGFWNSKW